MKKLNDRFKEVKNEQAVLENKRPLTGADLDQVEKIFNEVIEQINEIRREELELDPEK